MRKPRLPEVTHLQFLVLAVLQGGEPAGRTGRKAIGHYGVRRAAAAFYQMMARLERDGLVEGWYDQITIGDQAVTERRYRVTPAGGKEWEERRAGLRHGAPAV